MATYVALLRGINVGGKKPITMAELRSMAEDAGFESAQTWLQSGNLIFQGKAQATAAIEKKLEQATARHFGQEIDFLVREQKEWGAILDQNPFPREAKDDPSHLLVFCLRAEPKSDALAALKAAIAGRESFKPGARCLYIYYPDGIGRSKFTHALIERRLGIGGTGRNWNTAQKIAAMME